jgi:RND family efflux transporter MFP subunit
MNRMSPRRIRVLALVALLIGCAGPTPIPEKPRPVRTMTVTLARGNETLVQTGSIQPRRETDLGFPIDGRLVRRLVEVGAVVKKGQVLATLDADTVQNEVRGAEAELTSATSAVELAQASLGRQRQLFDGQIVSAQQMDEANASLRAASARRESAEAATLNAKRKLIYTSLLAPEAGVVTSVGANSGQVLAPGQMVVRVATLERDAVFDVAERVINSAPPDVKVLVQLVSNPAVSATGTVHELSPTADPVTHTYRVRIALPTPPEAMTFGAAVTGTVEFPSGPLVIVPSSALTSDGKEPAVYVVDPATQRIRRRAVDVARFGAEETFVSSGLGIGDLVVTAGVSKLRPDQVVALDAVEGGAQ